MRKFICDICGKELKRPDPGDYSMEKRDFLQAHRNGLFRLEYQSAVVNEKGEVIHFSFPDTHICDGCTEIANKAIWKALDPVIKARKKSVSVKVSGIPFEPEEESPTYFGYTSA